MERIFKARSHARAHAATHSTLSAVVVFGRTGAGTWGLSGTVTNRRSRTDRTHDSTSSTGPTDLKAVSTRSRSATCRTSRRVAEYVHRFAHLLCVRVASTACFLATHFFLCATRPARAYRGSHRRCRRSLRMALRLRTTHRTRLPRRNCRYLPRRRNRRKTTTTMQRKTKTTLQ